MRTAGWQAIPALAAACLTVCETGCRQAAQIGPYRISGVAVNGVTGKPLWLVRIHAAPDDGSSEELSATTGFNGRFVFNSLPAGAWTLRAERWGFVPQRYGERDAYLDASWASSVVTGPDGVSENLTFRLNPPAAIRGKVIDEHGAPVPGAHLQLLAPIPGGRKQLRVRKSTTTDERGEYRIEDLPAIQCYLFAIVPLPAGGLDAPGFRPQYYPNVTDPRAATPIQLKPGEKANADFTLRSARGVSVLVEGDSGIARGNDSELLLLLTQGPQASEVSAGTLTPGAGRTFYNVFPGRYKLVVGDVGSTYATSKWIDVGSEDVTVKLPFPDPPEVTAKVRVVDGDWGLLQKAMLRLQIFADGGNNSRPLRPDGTAVFPARAAGRHAVVLVAPGLYVKSVEAQNARVVDSFVDLPESGPVQLEIVAAGDGARVRGKVRNGGKPVCGALVVLAPIRPSLNSDDYRGYQSDTDGSFDFRSVKPGDYTIFATNDSQLEYGNPEAIDKYLAAGRAVKAEPKGSVDLELEMVRR